MSAAAQSSAATYWIGIDRPSTNLSALSCYGIAGIAIVGSQYFLRRGETADLYRLAEMLLPDQHDLIHKAMGWSLREAGKRVDRDELRRFLDQHAASMPRTALCYAIVHFEPAERQHYLAIPRHREPK